MSQLKENHLNWGPNLQSREDSSYLWQNFVHKILSKMSFGGGRRGIERKPFLHGNVLTGGKSGSKIYFSSRTTFMNDPLTNNIDFRRPSSSCNEAF